jgi:hypothetical protein
MEEAIAKIDDVISSSASGRYLDNYTINTPNGKCVVLVYEKYFYRVNNYLTLTIVLDDFINKTRLHIVGGGGGSGLLNIDLGAAESFASEVIDVMKQYKL